MGCYFWTFKSINPRRRAPKSIPKIRRQRRWQNLRRELAVVLQVLGGTGATSPDEIQRVMSELDTDGDGFIDLNEFKTFHCGGANDDELKEAFGLYDKDKNGKISASELHAVLKSLGEECSITDCRRMIGSVDIDGDGCVDFEEFKMMMTRDVHGDLICRLLIISHLISWTRINY